MSRHCETAYNVYPPSAVECASKICTKEPHACIVEVLADSPAADAGFEPGYVLLALDGEPLRDILDWRWRSYEDEMTLRYKDLEGNEGEVTLQRNEGEDWGFIFESPVFDGIQKCVNACSFCFMRQLPKGLRPSLSVRDDDYRLSFLSGTFVTLSNVSDEDEARIIEQRISPLHVSLHASEPEVRALLMGKNAERGMCVLERLLEAGIDCHCQIVLVPGVNDAEHLKATLEWAYERPRILNIGIVPLGYTSHQEVFQNGFDRPWQAEEVLELLKPYQERALSERGHAWVFAADEFYITAYGKQVFDLLPPVGFYGEFDLFEDGIGMVRSTLDEWDQAKQCGVLETCGKVLAQHDRRVFIVSGFAQQAYLTLLMRDSLLDGRLMPLYVENNFFGGNVDVTGLLTGQDILRTLKAFKGTLQPTRDIVAIPRVVFNDDGLTLDDMTLEDISNQIDVPVRMVSCSPLDCLNEVIGFVE